MNCLIFISKKTERMFSCCDARIKKSIKVFLKKQKFNSFFIYLKIYLKYSGCILFHSVASWYTFAMASNVASSYNLPTNVMLVGVCSLLNPVGKLIAGLPVRLVMAAWLPTHVGQMMASYFSITAFTCCIRI